MERRAGLGWSIMGILFVAGFLFMAGARPVRAEERLVAALQPTAAPVTIEARINTNCREGPSQKYKVVGYFVTGTNLPVLAVHTSEPWYLIQSPADEDESCWVWAGTTEVSGPEDTLPVLPKERPPKPTVPPEKPFTIDSVDLTYCGDTPAIIIGVTNNESWDIESVNLTIKDLDRGRYLVEPETDNVPFGVSNQTCRSHLEYLEPGEQLWISSYLDRPIRSGHAVEISLEFCAQDGLGGECVDKSVVFEAP